MKPSISAGIGLIDIPLQSKKAIRAKRIEELALACSGDGYIVTNDVQRQ